MSCILVLASFGEVERFGVGTSWILSVRCSYELSNRSLVLSVQSKVIKVLFSLSCSVDIDAYALFWLLLMKLAVVAKSNCSVYLLCAVCGGDEQCSM